LAFTPQNNFVLPDFNFRPLCDALKPELPLLRVPLHAAEPNSKAAFMKMGHNVHPLCSSSKIDGRNITPVFALKNGIKGS
jgi:hypothetical protein